MSGSSASGTDASGQSLTGSPGTHSPQTSAKVMKALTATCTPWVFPALFSNPDYERCQNDTAKLFKWSDIVNNILMDQNKTLLRSLETAKKHRTITTNKSECTERDKEVANLEKKLTAYTKTGESIADFRQTLLTTYDPFGDCPALIPDSLSKELGILRRSTRPSDALLRRAEALATEIWETMLKQECVGTEPDFYDRLNADSRTDLQEQSTACASQVH